ncbi:MAG TPA: PP2C family protein-serine/threonine phosphatase [Solirubrobacteraceae bacterium]|nr:PP2C family protein-serine/threonine phosphatase [Solirubrobacteraceae bacterium]
MSAVGGALSLPLPVPDWSKPIILLLLLAAIGLALRWLLTARRAKRLEAQRAELLGDLRAMQAALVPAVPADIASLGLSVAYRPADGAAAGGDFYDVFELDPGRVGLVLGDVCGHGRQALERAALTRYTVRAYLQAGLAPRAALALAGDVLADATSCEFATVMAAIYEPPTGRLTYASAGHPAPVVIGDAIPEPVGLCCSPPVGVGLPTGARQSAIAVSASSVVCFYTDGLTEARCEDGLLGVERLTQLLGGVGPAASSADQLLRRVTDDATRTPDDMAACILTPRVCSRSGPRVEELELDRETLAAGQPERFLAACGIPGPEIAELLERAGIVLRGHAKAVLRVELSREGVTASTAPGEPHTLGRRDASPNGSVVSPRVTPVQV